MGGKVYVKSLYLLFDLRTSCGELNHSTKLFKKSVQYRGDCLLLGWGAVELQRGAQLNHQPTQTGPRTHTLVKKQNNKYNCKQGVKTVH